MNRAPVARTVLTIGVSAVLLLIVVIGAGPLQSDAETLPGSGNAARSTSTLPPWAIEPPRSTATGPGILTVTRHSEVRDADGRFVAARSPLFEAWQGLSRRPDKSATPPWAAESAQQP